MVAIKPLMLDIIFGAACRMQFILDTIIFCYNYSDAKEKQKDGAQRLPRF